MKSQSWYLLLNQTTSASTCFVRLAVLIGQKRKLKILKLNYHYPEEVFQIELKNGALALSSNPLTIIEMFKGLFYKHYGERYYIGLQSSRLQ